MKPLKYTVAALAVIAVASFTQSAMAQASFGDVVLGVYDQNSTSLNSFELDLGAYSSILANPGESWNLGTTVETAFSSDSSSALVFNISAAASSAAASEGLAAKQIAFTAGTVGTLSSLNSTEYGQIQGMDNKYGNGTTAITLPSGTAQSVAVGTGSFETQENDNATGNWGEGGGNLPGFMLTSYPSDTTDFTFYTKASGSTSAVATGTFVFTQVDGNDILTFDPVATPEPSAYALGLCAVALFFVLRRRSTVA